MAKQVVGGLGNGEAEKAFEEDMSDTISKDIYWHNNAV